MNCRGTALKDVDTASIYREIVSRLQRVRRKEARLSLLFGVLISALVLLSVSLAGILLEQIFSFDPIGRALIYFLACAGVSVTMLRWMGVPLLKLVKVLGVEDDDATARKVGLHFYPIRDRLLDALQMYRGRQSPATNYSVTLVDASFHDLYRDIRDLDFCESVSDGRLRWIRKKVLYLLALAVCIFAVSPSSFINSVYRIANYGQSFGAAPATEFDVEPGNIKIVRGQSVHVTVRTRGNRVHTLTLLSRATGEDNFESQNVSPGGDGLFRASLDNIRTSTEYLVASADRKSTLFNVTVLDRPLLRSLQIKVISPAYTRIPPKTLDENIGDIVAYRGSRVVLQVISSKDLVSASLQFGDSTKLPLTARGTHAGITFSVQKNTTYHLLLADESGLVNLDPVDYSIKIIPDEYPIAEILSPARNVDLTGDMRMDLVIRIRDDFGFSRLRLAYRLTQSKYEKPSEAFSFLDVPLMKKDQSPAEVAFRWDPSKLNLVPDDAVSYCAEVYDNDVVSGPKSSRSETYLLRVPSLEEVFADITEKHDRSVESIQDVAKETEELRKDIESIQREMKGGRNRMDWQQQQKAEAMIQRYEAMKDKLNEASQNLQEAVKKMHDNAVLSKETQQKFEELKELIEKLKSPDLQEALRKLQESMKNLSPEELRRAMEQLTLSQEQFRSALERTIQLLKRIHIEQKLDELVKRADDLRQQQAGVKQDASRIDPGDERKRNELAMKQKGLLGPLESLQRETSELKKQMEEFPQEMPTEAMNKADSGLVNKEMKSKMSRSAQQMESGNTQKALEEQQEIQEGLAEFGEQLKQVQKSLQERQTAQIINQMRKQIEDLIELSERQEALSDVTKNLEPNSQRFPKTADQQSNLLNDVGNVANSLGELGKKSFAVSPEMGREIGNAMREMSEALQNMENRNPNGSSSKQMQAMSSLNRTAMLLRDALNGMMEGGQGGMGMAGLMGRLGQMASQQGRINTGTEQAMGMGQGQGQMMTPQQQAEYQRLAGEQAAAQKSLKQLSEEAKNSSDFSKLLGDLTHIAQEMQEVVSDLQQGNVNPNTLKEQDRILSRLLDSQRSMRERDYEKRRIAEIGKAIQHSSPAELDLMTQEGRDRLREELLKVKEGKYSRDYEELIRKYFEQLSREEKTH